MHEVLVNRLGGLSLPRKSVVRLTDRPDMTLDVYRGRKTTKQNNNTRIAGDFGLVAQNPLIVNGLLFLILSSSAFPVWDLIKTRIIKLFERKRRLRIYRPVIN